MLGYLKIFFERNNKVKSTFTALGNVFRNSKWSDLKVQNIKTSFIKSWSLYFLLLLILFSFSFYLLGTYSGNAVISQIPLLGDVYELLCFSWTHVEDLLKASLLSIASVWSYMKSIISQKIYKEKNYVYESLLLRSKSDVFTGDKSSSTLALSHEKAQNYTSVMSIEAMYVLSYASKSVDNVNTSVIPERSNLDYYSNSLATNFYIDYLNTQTPSQSICTPISNLEQSYTIMHQDVLTTQQFDTESSHLNKISLYNVALGLTNLSTQDALRNAKQDRWLVRNSLLSENLISNSNAFTQSKKLLGVNLLNSETASRNVWTSTKLSSLTSGDGTGFIANLQELFNNQPARSKNLIQLNFTNPNLDNFNFFENSRMWLVKKYFFTNQLKNNLTQASLTLFNNNDFSTSSLNTYNYSLFLNLYNQNPQNQLSYLVMSLRPVSLSHDTPSITSMYDFYVNAGDLDVLKSNNLTFLNKLTHSTSNKGLNYYSTITPTSLSDITLSTLTFERK